MITSETWRGKRYAVLGLARSGRATLDALLASGAEVVAWDSNEAARVGDCEFADPLTLDLTGFAGVVVSPGVPLNRHPIASHAAKHGVPVIGDIELFAQARAELPPHKVVGITGTNGKSTTTALVHHILKTAGVPTTMGGNIGLPILGQDPLPAGGVYVLELSSYQIDLTFSLDCDVAVLLNVTPDHLDRYDNLEAYKASKVRLFQMQSHEHVGVIGIDDPAMNEVWLDMVDGPGGWWKITSASHEDQPEWPTLQGPHNAQNVSAALAACLELGVHFDIRMSALRAYPGLPHRMERIRTRDGVLYVNDSKATNADSTAPALAAYPAIRWILGGQAKTADLDACSPHFGHVRSAYTIGEAGSMFADLLRPHMAVEEAGTLDVAVAHAARDATAGDTVLLSPACASFDQFQNFEDRGDRFRQLVGAL
ncbi:MAG: UDP-N-acetylmuramoyl-L-alanine--D-glutamate ligase [Pseudomonadota bacterium]